MEIGAKIKELRLAVGLTQEELADRCELTKGYISQLENDLTSPSISTLSDLLAALGSDLSEFFSGTVDERTVFTENDFIVKESGEGTITWLVPNSQKNTMEPIRFSLKAGERSYADMPHEGEEFGYVLSGEIFVVLKGKKQRVKAGEAFYFTSRVGHYVENAGGGEAVLIWVSSPPNF